MRIWKWIGLAVFIVAILVSRWLPSIVINLASLYCGLVILNLLFILLSLLKNHNCRAITQLFSAVVRKNLEGS